jgi:hypothetical protein
MSGTPPVPAPATNNTALPAQAVTGVVAPQTGEATIRQVWPSVIASRALAPLGRLAQALSDTIILRPLAWLLLLPLFVKNILPFLSERYRLTNRRLMIVRFGARQPHQEIPLADIEMVRIEPGSFNTYFRAATLEVIAKGQVAMHLRGVPEPESFRLAILHACRAWAPIRPKSELRPDKEAPVQGAR